MREAKNVYHISTLSIIKILAILLGLAFLWLIRDVIGLLFVAIIFASAFDPAVDWLRNRLKIPRGFGLMFIFILIIGALTTVIYLVTGPVIEEVIALSNNFPTYYQNVVTAWHQFQSLGSTETSSLVPNFPSFQLDQATNSLWGFLSGVFGSIFAFFLVTIMTFYLTIEEENMRRFIRTLSPEQYQPYLMQLMTKIQKRLGMWIRGYLLLSIIVFAMVYTGLSLLGVKYALVLALMAGAFEIVPFLGPILAAVPAIFLAFQQGPFLAVLVIILYFIVQQLENNLVVPRVMGKITGLNPIVVLIAILIGAKIAGIIGILLAVPVATAVGVFVRDFGGFENKG